MPFRYLYSSSSPSGLLAMKVGDDRFIQLFSVSDPMNRRKLACPFRTVGIALSPDENTIAGACEDGTLAVYDTRTLFTNGTMRNVLLGLHSVVFSPDGRRIVAGGNGREAIKIWDVDSLEDLATLEGKGSLFSSARFSPDGNMIAACGWSGILHVWRAPSLREISAKEQILPDDR
jgi:WD40 repeat protein